MTISTALATSASETFEEIKLSIHSQNRRDPATKPDICPRKLIPGRNDQIIPIPVSKHIDLNNLRSFFISHLMKTNLFFPYIVVNKIKASTPNKIPLNPIERDIVLPKTKISTIQQINVWRGIIKAMIAKKK